MCESSIAISSPDISFLKFVSFVLLRDKKMRFSAAKSKLIARNILYHPQWSVGFCRESRVEGNMSRVEGKMSRVQKCRRFFLLSFIVYIFYYYFLNFFVSKNIDFVYIQALSFESLVKKPEFLGRFSMTCIEQFTSVLYTIEYFRSVSRYSEDIQISLSSCPDTATAARKIIITGCMPGSRAQSQID